MSIATLGYHSYVSSTYSIHPATLPRTSTTQPVSAWWLPSGHHRLTSGSSRIASRAPASAGLTGRSERSPSRIAGGRVNGLLEPVVPPEDLVTDDDARHPADVRVGRALGRLAQARLDRVALHCLQDGARVHLRRRSRYGDVVGVTEVAAGGERLAEGGEGEGDR